MGVVIQPFKMASDNADVIGQLTTCYWILWPQFQLGFKMELMGKMPVWLKYAQCYKKCWDRMLNYTLCLSYQGKANLCKVSCMCISVRHVSWKDHIFEPGLYLSFCSSCSWRGVMFGIVFLTGSRTVILYSYSWTLVFSLRYYCLTRLENFTDPNDKFQG